MSWGYHSCLFLKIMQGIVVVPLRSKCVVSKIIFHHWVFYEKNIMCSDKFRRHSVKQTNGYVSLMQAYQGLECADMFCGLWRRT